MTVVTRRYRIVVALDLSEYSEIVLEHALDLASRYAQADLHFVTVVPNERADVIDTKNRLAEAVMDGLATFHAGAGDWHARLHVRAGKPEQEIVSLAGEIDADLIVIGRFGGSTAKRVVADAPCATLAIGLTDRGIQPPACEACVQVRAETDGDRWFCAEHSAPDRATLATAPLPSSIWTGGTVMW